MTAKPRLALALALTILLSAGRVTAGGTVHPFTAARMAALSTVSTVTRGDCVAAVAAFAFGVKASADPDASTLALVKRGILRTSDTGGLDRVASRGFACLLFKRALEEDGSVLAHVFGASEHYAYRHLEHLDLIPSGSSWVPITGPELVSLVSLSKQYDHAQRTGGEVRR